MQSIIISDFKRLDIRNVTSMPLITIYKYPKDFPDKYVARLWDTDSPTPYIVIDENLDRVRQSIPEWMFKLDADIADDKVILETWL